MTVRWLGSAIKDINTIYDYYIARNAKAATNIYNTLLNETERLALFPKLAPLEPLLINMKYEFRSLVVLSDYKIIYFIMSETIYVYRIWDCRQDPDKLQSEVELLH